MHALIVLIPVLVVSALVALTFMSSFRNIGPSEVGAVSKRFGKQLAEGSIIAMNGEAGYQAELLMPGWRFKFSLLYSVTKYPWVQVPAGEIGVIIAQVGAPIEQGAKSAKYNEELGDFSDLKKFLDNGGQKGVQRPLLAPGTLSPIHPVAFLVLTSQYVYGEPISEDLPIHGDHDDLSAESFGIESSMLKVTNITPREGKDVIGIVTALEGQPLENGAIAGRIGGYADITAAEGASTGPNEIISMLLATKNDLHNNYQNFQAFLDAGGRIGLQHDPLLYGAYLLNPFLVKVDIVDMLVVQQGREVRAQPALLLGRDCPDQHPDPQLGRGDQPSP
jgi:hypothetical protein